ncbi:hypothetical protein AJ78_06315 [Emergomyces pasteurianus Ep9510]|uniref:Uncharacterized protein n=1 Tax=Emergomyces pasteurianus Ep9510 TaxID=1447872 RepID=A0A1J9QDF2_9EURO|nr:hypothetical protein AJ78_06315 [Emergomyces pasteurianus Ep9510]
MNASQPKRFQQSISSLKKMQGQTSVRDFNSLHVKLKELINLNVQLVARHAQQGCHFTSDDYFQLSFSKQRIMICKTDSRLNATQILRATDEP